jgi:hypothetical protein
MHDPAYQLPRIHIPRTSVNKGEKKTEGQDLGRPRPAKDDLGLYRPAIILWRVGRAEVDAVRRHAHGVGRPVVYPLHLPPLMEPVRDAERDIMRLTKI